MRDGLQQKSDPLPQKYRRLKECNCISISRKIDRKGGGGGGGGGDTIVAGAVL